ncbi:MAG: glycosyltransferase WbuB [Moritella sp.]|nr:MAG: glycosyltransferase WbuB [Moritella sp.]
MNILVVSQYFWPENFRINDLCLALKERGHDVTILTGKPNYPTGTLFEDYIKDPELFDFFHEMPIFRAPIYTRKKGSVNLLLNYMSFLISGSLYGPFKLRNKEFDVIFVCQLSPVTAAIPAISLKYVKKIPIVMWSLDLWPESLEAVGTIKSKTALNFVGNLVSWIYKHCDVILGQSESYLDAVRRRSNDKTELVLFPNWAEDQFKTQCYKKEKESVLTIIFAGNIGDAQDFESIVECAKLLKENDIDVVFSIVGNGRKFSWLQMEIKKYKLGKLFILHGQHPLESMPYFYSEADVALVSLKPNDIFERTIPGKIQSYMLSSLPILAMLDGEGKKLIESASCGLTCSASDAISLFENIKIMSEMPLTSRQALGGNGKKYAERFFSKEMLISLLEGVLSDAVKGK